MPRGISNAPSPFNRVPKLPIVEETEQHICETCKYKGRIPPIYNVCTWGTNQNLPASYQQFLAVDNNMLLLSDGFTGCKTYERA